MAELKKLEHVAVVLKANVYFDGNVVSHTIECADGAKKTAGLIYPGTYHFGTGAAERMDIIAGSCTVKLAGASAWNTYGAGSFFEVPANSSFDITVASGITEYLCSYL